MPRNRKLLRSRYLLASGADVDDRTIAEIFDRAARARDWNTARKAHTAIEKRSEWGIYDRERFPISDDAIAAWTADSEHRQSLKGRSDLDFGERDPSNKYLRALGRVRAEHERVMAGHKPNWTKIEKLIDAAYNAATNETQRQDVAAFDFTTHEAPSQRSARASRSVDSTAEQNARRELARILGGR